MVELAQSQAHQWLTEPDSAWYDRATVRTASRRLADESDASLLPFSPSLTYVLQHPLLSCWDAERRRIVLQWRLSQYLCFTDWLETEAIVPACLFVARNHELLELPPQIGARARQIATDEMWHSQCAADTIRQVGEIIDASTPNVDRPGFLDSLNSIKKSHSNIDFDMLLLTFSIVSETLITKTLSAVPKDDRVMSVVRESVREHAQDEARHHRFFAEFLKYWWQRLTRNEQNFIAPHFGQFMKMFLEPDFPGACKSLEAAGLPCDMAKTVAWDMISLPDRDLEMQKSAAATIRHLRESGVLANKLAVDGVRSAGFRVE